MPDKKISELTPIAQTDLAATDVIPVVDSDAGQTKKITLAELDDRYHSCVIVDFTTDRNSRSDVHSLHGGAIHAVVGGTLSVGNDINLTNGVSRVMLALIAGTDFVGSITVSGTTVDRNTGVETPADSEIFTIDSLTTDASTVGSAGEPVHELVNAYLTAKWFKGAVIISTTNVDISNIDVYQVTFEQFDDHQNVQIDSFDIHFTVTNTAAFFTGHLYTVVQTGGGKADVTPIANLELLVGDSVLAPYRLRKGELNIQLSGLTSGIFIDLFFKPDNQTYFDSIACKAWARTIAPE